jgi:hypothetical protein
MGAYAEVRVGHAKPFEVDSDVFHLRRAGSREVPMVFSRKQLHALESGLRHHKRVSASITALLTDPTGNADYHQLTRSLGIRS